MKLFLIALLSLLSYHCSTRYPVVESSFAEELLVENATSIEYWFDSSNDTASNDSSPQDMHGIGKKVVEKVKGIKDKAKDVYDKVKDKAKDIYDKIKDKAKDVYDKVKDKVKDFKDKIGSKGGGFGGGSGGGYNKDIYDRDKYNRDYDRDKYNRDYDRDRYNRDYNRRDSNDGVGSGVTNPNAVPIAVGICIFLAVGGVAFVIIMKLREVYKK